MQSDARRPPITETEEEETSRLCWGCPCGWRCREEDGPEVTAGRARVRTVSGGAGGRGGGDGCCFLLPSLPLVNVVNVPQTESHHPDQAARPTLIEPEGVPEPQRTHDIVQLPPCSPTVCVRACVLNCTCNRTQRVVL